MNFLIHHDHNKSALSNVRAPRLSRLNGPKQCTEKSFFLRLLKNAPAFAEAASRRQADARRPQCFSPADQAGNPEE
jgi:hypothetical protein